MAHEPQCLPIQCAAPGLRSFPHCARDSAGHSYFHAGLAPTHASHTKFKSPWSLVWNDLHLLMHCIQITVSWFRLQLLSRLRFPVQTICKLFGYTFFQKITVCLKILYFLRRTKLLARNSRGKEFLFIHLSLQNLVTGLMTLVRVTGNPSFQPPNESLRLSTFESLRAADLPWISSVHLSAY